MDIGQGIAIGLPSTGTAIAAIITLYKYSANKPRKAESTMSGQDNTLFNRFMDLSAKHIEQLTILNGSLRSVHDKGNDTNSIVKKIESNQHSNDIAAKESRVRIENDLDKLK